MVRDRTEGERDRDRILYSTAFHRLAGITQTVPAGTGQVVHSRLTHSLKVAQVARRLAQRVVARHPDLADEVDPDSVEAAALAHDLGHPPFGHIAEKVLDALGDKAGCGGFEGNAQSFRIVTRLAQRWLPGADGEQWGLNLTRRTLNGLLKYPWLRDTSDPVKDRKWGAYKNDEHAFQWVRADLPSETRVVAAELMDWADDVTYAIHDMEDFFRGGLVPLDRLCTNSDERDRFKASFRAAPDGDKPNERLQEFDLKDLDHAAEMLLAEVLDFVDPYAGDRAQRQLLRQRSSFLVSHYMHALSIEDHAVVIDETARHEIAVLKELTWFYVIKRPELATVQEGQRRTIQGLFEILTEAATSGALDMFPPLEREALVEAETKKGRARVVIDYIARLTEDRASELHRRMAGFAPAQLPPTNH